MSNTWGKKLKIGSDFKGKLCSTTGAHSEHPKAPPPGDAKCVTEILGKGAKIRKLAEGQNVPVCFMGNKCIKPIKQ